MTIFLIAACPSIVILAIAVFTGCKIKVTLVALGMAALGIMTGNPAYAALDLLFVGLGYYFALAYIRQNGTKRRVKKRLPPPPSTMASEPPPLARVARGRLFTLFVWAGIATGALFFAIGMFSPQTTPSSVLPVSIPQAKVSAQEPVQPKKQKTADKIDLHNKSDGEAEQARREAVIQDLRDNCKPPTCRIVN